MSTVGDLCTLALRDSGVIGVGQTPRAEDVNDAFTRLNWMLSQWARKRWLVYSLTDVSFVSTGAVSYTVGPGGDFNTPRPDRLEDGNFMRQLNTAPPNQIDYPLALILAKEDYNRIRLKHQGTWPSVVFYDSQFPVGDVFFWPVPQAALYELHILVKTPLTAFTGLSQEISLPPEYEAALYSNLMPRLRLAYRLPPDPVMIGLAKDALAVIRGANIQVPELRMPPAVIGTQRSYNVFSDGY
jgi:hypothetical protein